MSSTNYPPYSSNLTETIYITSEYVSGGDVFSLPASSNLTETVVVSALPCISYVHYSKYGRRSTYRDVTITGNFLFLDNIYLSATDNSLFTTLTTEYVDFFTDENLTSLKYLPTTIYNLTNAYPGISAVRVTSFIKVSDTKVIFTLPPLSSFSNGTLINFITFNKSGYCISDGITVFDAVPATPTPTPTVTPTPTITPTNTPTPSVTSSLTPTPSITSTLTPTPTVTPSITPTNSVTPTITPTPTVTPTLTPSVTPTPTLANALIITGIGNDYAAYGCYTLTYVGPVAYSIVVNQVQYVINDNIIQYTNNSISTSQLTFIPSLNGWYLQGLGEGGQVNYAYKPGGLDYNINSAFTVLTGGGSVTVNIFPFCFTPTPTPTPTPSITPTPSPN